MTLEESAKGLHLNPDGTFGPTRNKKSYIVMPYHAKTGKVKKPSDQKTRWEIAANQHYYLFALADACDWKCSESKNYFAVHDDCKTKLGNGGERIAFFTCVNPDNGTIPWHGYPVLSQDYCPPDTLLDSWEKNGIISSPVKKNIERKRI